MREGLTVGNERQVDEVRGKGVVRVVKCRGREGGRGV